MIKFLTFLIAVSHKLLKYFNTSKNQTVTLTGITTYYKDTHLHDKIIQVTLDHTFLKISHTDLHLLKLQSHKL